MNRRQRRDHQRRLSKIGSELDALMNASEADGKPWVIRGMSGACRDCGATGSMRGRGRHGTVVAEIRHDHGCPAARGLVDWKPVAP